MSVVMSRLRWLLAGRNSASAVMQTLVGRVAIIGINLGNGIITARALGAYGRGEQAAMNLWPQFLVFLFALGIPFAMLYHGRRTNDRDALISTSLVLSLALGLIATLVGVLFIPLWLHKYDAETIRQAQFLMVFAPPLMLSLSFSSIYEMRLNFSQSNLLRFVPPALTLVLLLGLAAFHRFTPFYSALAYSIPATVLTVWVGWRLRDTFAFHLRGFKAQARQLFSYGLRVHGASVLGTFGGQVDQVLVVGLLTPADLGTYVVALSASRVLGVFQGAFNVVLLPRAAGESDDNAVAMVARAARVSGALSLLAGLALAAVLPFVLPHLYGKDFTRAVILAQILIAESILASLTSVLAQTFMATNRPGVTTILQGIGLGFSVPLMLLLIPRLGLPGAAIALLLSTASRFAFVCASFPLLLRRPCPPLILTPEDVRFVRNAVRLKKGAA